MKRIFLVLVILQYSSVLIAAKFYALGTLGVYDGAHNGENDWYSYGTAVSNDGAVTGITGSNRETGFIWTKSRGMLSLDSFDDNPRSIRNLGTRSISADGNYVVGWGMPSQSGDASAYVWSRATGYQWLREVNSFHANDISADGSTVVVGDQLWHQDGTVQDVGVLPNADVAGLSALSIDARFAVGSSGADSDNGRIDWREAFLWSETAGIRSLGKLPGYTDSGAGGVSDDGRIVVGTSFVLNKWGYPGDGEAFIWTEEAGMRGLGFLPNQTVSRATAVSGDGSLVIGNSGGVGDPFLWTESTGILNLQDVLEENFGLRSELEGWRLRQVWDISPNGRFLTGNAWRPDGDVEAWLVQLRSDAGDFDDNGTLDVEDIWRLSTSINAASADPVFDLNADTAVDDRDLQFWIHNLKDTWIGDANLDGEFNSSDLVAVLAIGKYEQDIDAKWSEGDWTADMRFSTADLVVALQDGGFEQGPRAATKAVPVPPTALLLLSACCYFLPRLRRLAPLLIQGL